VTRTRAALILTLGFGAVAMAVILALVIALIMAYWGPR